MVYTMQGNPGEVEGAGSHSPLVAGALMQLSLQPTQLLGETRGKQLLQPGRNAALPGTCGAADMWLCKA